MGLTRKWHWGRINRTNYYMDNERQGEGENKIDNGSKFGQTCLYILVLMCETCLKVGVPEGLCPLVNEDNNQNIFQMEEI